VAGAGEIDLGIDDLERFEKIGSGGFATVYSAWDLAFRRAVAVKVFKIDDASVRRSFERERGFMGQLSNHPNVVTPYRYGFTSDDSYYIVMELMTGGSLQSLLDENGPVSFDQSVEYLLPIVSALDHAHSQGVLHKDVKPGNILLSATGEPKLTDFGISTLRESTATQVSFTLAHTAPETFSDTQSPQPCSPC